MVVLLLVLSTVFGVVAYWRFTRSDRYLAAALREMKAEGTPPSPEDCVDRVLRWRDHCEAMQSLCDASVPRMMEACLRCSDQGGYCRGLGSAFMATQFGVPQCRERKLDRPHKKICALSYRAIATHCERLGAAVRKDIP